MRFSGMPQRPKPVKKILKQVEYESARRKRHINEKTRKRDEEGSTFFYVHLSRELKGTQGKWRELEGTCNFQREALVEVNEGKKLRKRGKEVKFQKSEKKQKTKRKQRSALHTFKNGI